MRSANYGFRKALLASSWLFASVALGGCATEDYVNTHIAAVNARVDQTDGRLGALETRVTDVSQRTDTAAAAAQNAAGVAQAAGTAAQAAATAAGAASADAQRAVIYISCWYDTHTHTHTHTRTPTRTRTRTRTFTNRHNEARVRRISVRSTMPSVSRGHLSPVCINQCAIRRCRSAAGLQRGSTG